MATEKAEKPTMYAIRYTASAGGIEKNFETKKDAPQPPLSKDGQTLVQIACAALNPVDYKFPESPVMGRFAIGFPATPGLDYAGIVSSTKDSTLKPGQRVFGRLPMPTKYGVLAEYTVATSAGCIPLPEGISFAEAAAIGTAGMSAWRSIVPFQQQLGEGARIFVNGGSGGVGTFTIQIAKAFGYHVTTTCSSRNTEFVKELGADDVLEYDKVDVVKTLTDLVKGDPSKAFALAVDNVSTPADLYKAADVYLKPEGTFVQVGAYPTLSGVVSLAGRAGRPALLGGGKRKWAMVDLTNKREDFEVLAKLIAQRKVRSVIDETFGFGEAQKAYEKLKTGRAKGKIVVNVGDA